MKLCFNWAYEANCMLVWSAQETDYKPGRWRNKHSDNPWSKLFCWFCCRKHCSCCHMSSGCRKDPTTDWGDSSNQYISNCLPLVLFWLSSFTPNMSKQPVSGHLPRPLGPQVLSGLLRGTWSAIQCADLGSLEGVVGNLQIIPSTDSIFGDKY